MHHIASKIFGRPHLVHPERARVILWALRNRLGIEAEKPSREASAFFGRPARSGLYRIENGAAIIPVIGTLVNRGAWVGAESGLVSYEGLAAQVREAVEDDEVERIVLDLDSPGGMVDGAFLLAEQIRQARVSKPVTAVVNDMAASAAYLLASQADEIVISPTSMVGSIGVIYIHWDESRAIEAAGLKATIITAGEHKADGNPYEPLPDDVRDDIQRELNRIWELFIKAVHLGRPSLSPAAIKAMEARVYSGEEAIEAGLADRIGRLEEVLGMEDEMAETKDRESANGRATADAGIGSDALAKARAEGAAAERERIKAIISLPAAEKRLKLAVRLAVTSGVSPDEAAEILAAAPEEQAGDPLAVTSAGGDSLGLELANAAAGPAKEDPMARWEQVLKNAEGSLSNADH